MLKFHRILPLLLLTVSFGAFAHTIPNDVTVQAFLKPEGQKLRLLVRIPVAAVRDMEFPVRGTQGYMDLTKSESMMPDAATLWISDQIKLYESDLQLSKPAVVETRISLLSDKSFASYEQALAHVTGPRLDPETTTLWEQTMLDVLFEYPIQKADAPFSINPDGLARLGLRTLTVLRFILPNGTIRAFEYEGLPGLLRLDPHWYQAAGQFVRLGFFHILDGTDHMLFLFCLVAPFRKFRALIPVVTAFTLAHSITLIASAYDLAPNVLWFPPLIEVLIATSIVYMALENIVGGARVQRRWLMTFGFGLVHGFGFSFALREKLQFAGSHLLASLLAFNVGVELGQLLVLAILIALLELLFRKVVDEARGTIIVSALAADVGWHWMRERWDLLVRFQFQWPEINALFLAGFFQWTAVALVLGYALWFVDRWLKRMNQPAANTAASNAISATPNAGH